MTVLEHGSATRLGCQKHDASPTEVSMKCLPYKVFSQMSPSYPTKSPNKGIL